MLKNIFAIIFSTLISPIYGNDQDCSSLPQAIIFDIMGTCVEIKTSLLAQGKTWNEKNHLSVDWSHLIDDWINGHTSAINQILIGNSEWESIDLIHQKDLERILPRYIEKSVDVSPLEIKQINQFWHSLTPWPDVMNGLIQLHKHFKLVAFSNANISLLKDISSFGSLPWDEQISAEEIKRYKPDPSFYLYAIRRLNLLPNKILLVASHPYDLKAAQKVGIRTAYIPRKKEHNTIKQFDFIAKDFQDLSEQLIKQIELCNLSGQN